MLYALMFLSFLIIPVLITTLLSAKISGRVMSLIDPSYAKNNAPLIASVSEHMPTMWVNFW